LILAFVTSWAAYQTLVYNVLFDGPQQIARVLLAQADRLGGTFGGDVFSGLEKSFYDLTNVAAVYGKQAGGNVNILQGGPALGAGLLWISAVAMLLSSVGLLLACKIVLGFLLALGPLFIGLFLFDATRGFFDGWLRTTIAFALTPLATTVLAAAMLLMLAPSIARLKQVANAERFDMGPIVTIAIIVAVFGLVMLQALRLGYGIAGGFRSRRRSDATPSQTAAAAQPYSPLVFMENSRVRDVNALHPSERFSSQSIRGARENRSGFESGESRRIIEIAHSVSDKPAAPPPRLGEAYRRVPLPGIRRGEAY
jgi:type IV secretion system protein VirB6